MDNGGNWEVTHGGMEKMTHDQLHALATSGASNREIETAIGHALTPEDRRVIDRARIIRKLNAAKARSERVRQAQIKIADMPDGRSARTECDRLRALQIGYKLLEASGRLVWRHQVEATTAMVWEMVANDLRFTLPGEVADRMPNAAIAAQVRKAVREAVETCIESWRKAGCVINESEGTAAKAGKRRARRGKAE